MNIAFCYESVLPARGGCETYIGDLARRLLADRHQVHLYACRWDEKELPTRIEYHGLPPVGGPRFLRPWRFAAHCLEALRHSRHDVTIGFDKTWGLDVLYPQGGLHVASQEHNIHKHAGRFGRALARLVKAIDPVCWSYSRLERKQYLEGNRSQVIVNSYMVRHHFHQYYGVPPENLHVVRSAIDPNRFPEHDRPRRRQQWRDQLDIGPAESVGLFAAMNYHLKGLDPLLHAVKCLLEDSTQRSSPPAFRLVVAGNPKFGAYQRLARRLGIEQHVLFIGPRRDMRDCYFGADFLVHPTFYDPCSLVVLEALACGLPVITSRYNGASELLHPLQEGYVVEDPHDHERLAWCLGQLLDPVRRAGCAQAARRTAQGWTFEHHYRQLLDVFSRVTASKRAA